MSLSLQLPDTFSHVFGMGIPHQVYSLSKKTRWGNLAAAIAMLSIAGLSLLYGLYQVIERYFQFGPAVLKNSLSANLVFFIIGGVCLLLGVGAAWSTYSNWGKAAATYSNGIAYTDRQGLRAWRWDEFDSLTSAVTRHYTNGIYTGTTHIYTLRKRDGEKLVLNDSLHNVEELAGHIRQNVFPRLYEQHVEAYNQGKALVYGPVTISKTGGLQIGGKSFAWEEIEKVTVNQGILSAARQGGGWFSGASAPTASIPNLEVLLAIIDQVVGL